MIDANTPTHPLAERPTYTDDQLSQYLQHLHYHLPLSVPFPPSFQDVPSLRDAARTSPVSTLSTLMKMHLSTTPWGSLALHYSPTHTLPLTPPSHLFHKLITRRIGGYCMEQNLFFSHILRSLGYEIYLTGARISHAVNADPSRSNDDKDGYGGFEHMLILALIDDGTGHGVRKFVVDVGYGAYNALSPLLLRENEECACQPGSMGRVVRRSIAASTQRTKQEMWVFQSKTVGKKKGEKSGEGEGEGSWTNAYCFAEMEWFQTDFEVSNFRTSMDPSSWFRHMFILTRMVLRGEEGMEGEGRDVLDVVGSVTFTDGVLTKRIGGGKSETIRECETEDERVELLRAWFGVELTQEEREGIRGWKSELKRSE